MQMKKLHPLFKNKTALHYLNAYSFFKTIYIRLIWYVPGLCDVFSNLTEYAAIFFQKIKFHGYWRNLNYRLHEYWYLRGLFENADSFPNLKLSMDNSAKLNETETCMIDLKEGLQHAEEKINKLKPLELEVFYGEKKIGIIPYEAGHESVKGIHLRKILKEQFTNELYSVLK